MSAAPLAPSAAAPYAAPSAALPAAAPTAAPEAPLGVRARAAATAAGFGTAHPSLGRGDKTPVALSCAYIIGAILIPCGGLGGGGGGRRERTLRAAGRPARAPSPCARATKPHP